MEKLHTVQEIYKDPESFLNRNIQIGGWVRSKPELPEFRLSDGAGRKLLSDAAGSLWNHMENFQENFPAERGIRGYCPGTAGAHPGGQAAV